MRGGSAPAGPGPGQGPHFPAQGRAQRPEARAALTEVQELLHGKRGRREARVEVHLARNAALRRRPGARVGGKAAAGAGASREQPGAPAGRGGSAQQPRQPHAEPRRRSRSRGRQVAAPRLGPAVREGRGDPQGRGAAVTAAATAPLAGARPPAPLGGTQRGRRGERRERARGPPLCQSPASARGGGAGERGGG